jgi:CPA1 family monovalent cation:H+ antiporter
MAGLELILLLLALSAGLRIVAERLTIPYSALLVVGGLLLALVPHLPRVDVSPDVLFLVFVPPLLYWGAVSFPLRDFRREIGPILRLAVVMVLVSVVAIALIAHSIDREFTWPAAFALGAIVSPPDPVAVLSVMRSLRLPRAIESILEGEGLLNDATALVSYRMAVAAAVTGAFSPWRATLQFVVAAAGGLLVGVLVGMVVIRLHRLTKSVAVAENTVSLLTPFAAFLPAELFNASGVVAVVAAAMYIARNVQSVGSPATRLQNSAMWSVVTFLLESLVFILVGLELPSVTHALDRSSVSVLLTETAIICVCVVLVRVMWIMPSTYIARSFGRWVRGSHEPLPSWREVFFIGWAGIRGGDSLVIALALPFATASGAPFPARDRIVFMTFSVILVTLIVQGPTLRPLARWLRLRADGRVYDEEAHARLTAAEAGLRALDRMTGDHYPEVTRYLRQRHRQRARRWAARESRQMAASPNELAHDHFVTAPSHDAGVLDERRATEYRRVRSMMIQAEQQALLALRDRGEIGDDVMRNVQRELDLEQVLLDSPEPVVEPAREVDEKLR